MCYNIKSEVVFLFYHGERLLRVAPVLVNVNWENDVLNKEVDWYKGQSGYLPRSNYSLLDRLGLWIGCGTIVGLGGYFLLEKLGGINGPLGRMLGLSALMEFLSQIWRFVM